MAKKATLWISLILLIIGGLNWGLVGIFKYNLVTSIFGVNSVLARIVFAVVGVAAVVEIIAQIAMASRKSSETLANS